MPMYAYQCEDGHETVRLFKAFPQRVPPMTMCSTCGKPARRSIRLEVSQPHAEVPELVSVSCGCHPDQAAEFTREYGHMGVRWRGDGKAVFTNRRAQLDYLKARKMHNEDEVRG